MGLSCRSIAQPGGFGLEVTSESVSCCWCVIRETAGRGRAGPAVRMRLRNNGLCTDGFGRRGRRNQAGKRMLNPVSRDVIQERRWVTLSEEKSPASWNQGDSHD